MDEDGYIRLDRYSFEKRKINLRKDAQFEMLESIKDLTDKYLLELKLRKINHKACEDNIDDSLGEIERIIMIRYVVFTQFSQALYPLVYMIILRRLLGTTLVHSAICLENKLSCH